MSTIAYIISGVLVFIALYKAFTFLLSLTLKAKLKRGDLNTFRKVLGENYQRRILINGLTRYKWSSLWMTIKADFDENGKLIYSKIMPIYLLSLKSQLFFTSKA
jgi:hypothetical protein